MGVATAEELIKADSNLTHSFVASILMGVGSLGWALFAGLNAQAAALGPWIPLLIGVLQIAAYVWYAMSAGTAARMLGAVGWHYVLWIFAAPFAALLPIPIVPALIGFSPLVIKFLLGGQLQAAIRDASFADLHGA